VLYLFPWAAATRLLKKCVPVRYLICTATGKPYVVCPVVCCVFLYQAHTIPMFALCPQGHTAKHTFIVCFHYTHDNYSSSQCVVGGTHGELDHMICTWAPVVDGRQYRRRPLTFAECWTCDARRRLTTGTSASRRLPRHTPDFFWNWSSCVWLGTQWSRRLTLLPHRITIPLLYFSACPILNTMTSPPCAR
jgi:hypothetical protein